MADWWGVSGKRVVVLGAGGLGAACVRAFVELDCSVTCIDASPNRLDELRSELPVLPTITADLTSSASADEALAAADRSLGGMDVVVHAVGVNARWPIEDTSDDDWDRMLAVNLSSAFYVGRAAGRTMVPRRSGRIVYFSSVAGRMAHKHHGPYAATKAGLDQLVGVMANEWAPHGVTVNAVAPGYTETALTSEHLAKPGVRDHLTSLVPAGKLGSVDDVTGAVAFLASERASYVTGHVIYVDGGRTLV